MQIDFYTYTTKISFSGNEFQIHKKTIPLFIKETTQYEVRNFFQIHIGMLAVSVIKIYEC